MTISNIDDWLVLFAIEYSPLRDMVTLSHILPCREQLSNSGTGEMGLLSTFTVRIYMLAGLIPADFITVYLRHTWRE